MTLAFSDPSKEGDRIYVLAFLAEHMDSHCASPSLNIHDESFMKLKMNLSLLTIPDFCLTKSPSELPKMFLLPLGDSSDYNTMLLPDPDSLLALAASSCLQSRDVPVSKAGPGDASETLPQITAANQRVGQPSPLQQGKQRESGSLDDGVGPPSAKLISRFNQTDEPLWSSVSYMQPLTVQALKAGVEARKRRLASQNRVLVSRADSTRRRLHALLGKIAVRHCDEQLADLKSKLLSSSTNDFSDVQNTCFNTSVLQEGSSLLDPSSVQERSLGGVLGQQEGSWSSELSYRDISSFLQSGRSVLRETQRALDSDATDSSSDEEWETEKTPGSRPELGCVGCEWQYQRNRAKLASYWTWLTLRLSALEFHIQKISKLHQHLLANKGKVTLAKSQPLTDRQIQQMLLTETAGLASTGKKTHSLHNDIDSEPLSPMRLLRNIERQSAQLSQIVNSLLTPLSASPPCSPEAKRNCRHREGPKKRAFNRSGSDTFCSQDMSLEEAARKKRRMCHWDLISSRPDVTCVSARTRPVLTYYKPRLFTMDQSSLTEQKPDSSSRCCASCVPCDPMTGWSGLTCSGTTNGYTDPAHLMLPTQKNSASFVSPTLYQEDWLQPLHHCSLLSGFISEDKQPNSIFNCTHQLKLGMHVRHPKAKTTPVRWAKTRNNRQALKRRNSSQPDVAFMFSPNSEVSVGEGLTPNCRNTQRKYPQFSEQSQNSENVYNINNIVVPMTLAASALAEKLQYKDIPTPSWRRVELSPLVENEEVGKEENHECELLSDKMFTKRHQNCEYREKLRWSSWEKGSRFTCRTRLSSRGYVYASGKPSQDSWTLSSPPEQSVEENRELKEPWEKRVFPLSETENEALCCEDSALTPPSAGHNKNYRKLTENPPRPVIPSYLPGVVLLGHISDSLSKIF